MAVNTPLDIEKAPIETRVLANGTVVDAKTGRFLSNPGGGSTAITKANSREYARLRREKTAALLRRRIVEAHNGSMPSLVHSSAEAFAEAGAMIYEQVVINSEEHARDRLEAFEKLGRYADVLGDPRAGDEPTPLQQATEYTESLARLVSEFRASLSAAPKVQIHEANSAVISANE